MGTSCTTPQEEMAFPDDEIAEGDLAFRCGQGIFSRAVTAVEENGAYSHVGIIVMHEDRWRVVHAVPRERENRGDYDRVKIEDLDVFFSPDRALKGCLVHTDVKDSAIVKTICQKAILSARDSIRFDHDYNLEDSSKVYCTEFVWRLYRECGIDISEGRRRFINAFHIKGDVIMPEHVYAYRNNTVYFSY